MSERLADIVLGLAFGLGLALVAVGVALIEFEAGLIVLGAILVGCSLIYERGRA